MLTKRIQNHRTVMWIGAIFHLLIIIWAGFEISVAHKQSTQCSGLHFIDRLFYALANFLLLLYLTHLARKAKIQSMDIYIFDHQLRIIKGLFILPIGTLALYYASNTMCPSRLFPVSTIAVYLMLLVGELLGLHMYISWYQSELKRYGGGGDTAEPEPGSTELAQGHSSNP
jgi:hypothetical protein